MHNGTPNSTWTPVAILEISNDSTHGMTNGHQNSNENMQNMSNQQPDSTAGHDL